MDFTKLNKAAAFIAHLFFTLFVACPAIVVFLMLIVLQYVLEGLTTFVVLLIDSLDSIMSTISRAFDKWTK